MAHVLNRQITGDPAVNYVGAWMQSAGRGGLNARRLTADAHAGGRSTLALARLRLACTSASWRVTLTPALVHRVVRAPRERRASRSRSTASARSAPARPSSAA